MTLILDEQTETLLTGCDDDLNHLYCCDENRSLCGIDLTDVPVVDVDPDEDPDLCVVCRDLEFRTCERCGA